MTTTAALRRIDGATSQRVFDTLLRTLAEPGRILRFGDEVLDMPAVALGPLALADVDVTVAVLGDGADLAADLAGDLFRATGARIVAACDADLVIADPALLGRPVVAADLDGLTIGSPLAPEDACRLFVAVDALHAIGPTDTGTGTGTRARLSGPGIAGHRHIGIDGLAVDVLTHLGRASGTFPTGIDTWLVAPDGAVVGLPRSTTVELATPSDTDSLTTTDQEA